MYKILGSDKKEYGPVSAEVVRQWIAGRRANGQTLMQAEGSADWRPLSDFAEFKDALGSRTGPPPISPAPVRPAPVPSAPVRKSGLAITSMVLGLLSMTCFPIVFTGLAAVITGHIARKRVRRSAELYGGSGFALAGLILGYPGIVLPLIIGAGLLLPQIARNAKDAESTHCVNNLKQITLAARIWSNDHDDLFPPDFKSLATELSSPAVLVCPGDKAPAPGKQATLPTPDAAHITYQYLSPGIKEEDALRKDIFRCPIHGHVARGDGSVQ